MVCSPQVYAFRIQEAMLTLYLKVQRTNIICCLWSTLGLGFLGFFFASLSLGNTSWKHHALSHGKINCGA